MTKFHIALFAALLPSAAFCADAPAQAKDQPSAPAAPAPAQTVEPIIKLDAPAPAAKPAMTEQQQTLYGLGIWLAQKIDIFHLSADELKTVEAGLRDSILGRKLQVNLVSVGPKINDLAKQRYEVVVTKEKAAGKVYAAKAAKEKKAKVLPSGLVLIPLAEGTGDSPKETDTVTVNYEGKLTNGKVFDSSYQRNKPAEFKLNQVVPCWTEGVQKMKVGGKARLVCPSDLAYQDRGQPEGGILGGATLDFTIELLDIKKGDDAKSEEKKPTAKAAAPSAAGQKAALEKAAKEDGAVKLPSGVVYRSLKEGAGDSPKASDTVKVHYRGTLIDGSEFDSSYKRGQPATFPLGGVIPCWTEGVQKIKVGGKAKLTCPAETAYGDHGPPGIGNGATLTFEVELLDIVK